jgi:hypothetical protein
MFGSSFARRSTNFSIPLRARRSKKTRKILPMIRKKRRISISTIAR